MKSKGLPKNSNDMEDLESILEDSLELELSYIEDNELDDDDILEGVVKRVCNKVCYKTLGKKPIITTFINRIS